MGARFEAKCDFYGSLTLLPFLLWFCHYGSSRVSRLKSLDSLWKRLFLGCLLTLLINNVATLIRGLSSLFFIRDQSQGQSAEMLACRVSGTIVDCSNGVLFSLLLWFWFRRLELAFGRARSELKVSMLTSRLFITSIWLSITMATGMAIWTGVKSTRSYSPGWGYQCQLQTRQQKWTLWYFWSIWTALYFALLCLVSYLYISKLYGIRTELESGAESPSRSVLKRDRQIAYVAKKSLLCAMLSFVSSALVMWFDPAYFFYTLDGVFNAVLVLVQFKFAERLYRLMFFCCLREGWICQRCVNLSEPSVGGFSVTSASGGREIVSTVTVETSGVTTIEPNPVDFIPSTPLELVSMGSQSGD